MLERRGLWLGPWRQEPARPGEAGDPKTAPSPERSRPVLDLVTRERLGVVRSQTGPGWPLLRRLLARPLLSVYETEDESLVCTLRRSWGISRSWEVCDAEDGRVAVVYSRWILDEVNNLLARIHGPTAADPGRFIALDDTELGTFRTGTDGTALTFATRLPLDPFARMAMLAAVLALDS